VIAANVIGTIDCLVFEQAGVNVESTKEKINKPTGSEQ